jgi:hypothetical protein
MTLVNDQGGKVFWKTDIRTITVCLNNVPRPISLPIDINSTVYLVAVLGSGVPPTIMTPEIANGIYSILGIRPLLRVNVSDRSEDERRVLEHTLKPFG